MALPNVKIQFTDGNIGAFTPSADGVVALVKTASSAHRSVLYAPNSSADVQAFYKEAGTGAELWLFEVLAASIGTASAVAALLVTIAKESKGRVKHVYLPSSCLPYLSDIQATLVDIAATQYAPMVVWVCDEGETAGDYTETAYDRIAVMRVPNANVAMAILGRVAKSEVHIHIGKVADGALAGVDDLATDFDSIGYYNKNLLTVRSFVGRAGVFVADDNLAALGTSDYHFLARRRTADKAFRIAYETLLQFVNSEIEITSGGAIAPSAAAAIEGVLENAIARQMAKNLSPSDTDMGVVVSVGTENNIAADNTLYLSLKVRPYAYAKFIEVNLGFTIG